METRNTILAPVVLQFASFILESVSIPKPDKEKCMCEIGIQSYNSHAVGNYG